MIPCMELTFVFGAAGGDLTLGVRDLFFDSRMNWRLRRAFSPTKLSLHGSFAGNRNKLS